MQDHCEYPLLCHPGTNFQIGIGHRSTLHHYLWSCLLATHTLLWHQTGIFIPLLLHLIFFLFFKLINGHWNICLGSKFLYFDDIRIDMRGQRNQISIIWLEMCPHLWCPFGQWWPSISTLGQHKIQMDCILYIIFLIDINLYNLINSINFFIYL